MKVVNIVPEALLDLATTKTFCAIDWSLQRWNEEGKKVSHDMVEEEGLMDIEDIAHRDMRSKRVNDSYDEEDEEEDDEEVYEEYVEEEDNVIVDLRESEEAEEVEEEGEKDDESDDEDQNIDEDVIAEVMDEVMAEVIAEAETTVLNLKASQLILSPTAMSPEIMSP